MVRSWVFLPHAALTDFGCAISHENHTLRRMVGSVFWMAPEVLRKDPYGTSADIWSVGVTLYELLAGRVPDGKQRLRAMLRQCLVGIVPPTSSSPAAQRALNDCLAIDVRKRATAPDLLRCSFITATADRTKLKIALTDYLRFKALSDAMGVDSNL